jgi:hypothetical protein
MSQVTTPIRNRRGITVLALVLLIVLVIAVVILVSRYVAV